MKIFSHETIFAFCFFAMAELWRRKEKTVIGPPKIYPSWADTVTCITGEEVRVEIVHHRSFETVKIIE